MKIKKIIKELNLETVYQVEDVEKIAIKNACGADLMSDVLAFTYTFCTFSLC